MNTTTIPVDATLALVDMLLTGGYTLQTSVATVRGGHLVWVHGPAEMAGFHATFVVGRTGKVKRGQVFPRGESGKRLDITGSTNVRMAISAALHAISRDVTRQEWYDQICAFLRDGDSPTLAELDAAHHAA